MSQATAINELIARFAYVGYHECESFCKLEITGTTHHALVVMTELKENVGTSITNRSERIAEEVVHRYGLQPGRCIFVEHYDQNSYNSGTAKDIHWALVTYDWAGKTASSPEWSYISAGQFSALQDMFECPRKSSL